jgi:hypothetical protein
MNDVRAGFSSTQDPKKWRAMGLLVVHALVNKVIMSPDFGQGNAQAVGEAIFS